MGESCSWLAGWWDLGSFDLLRDLFKNAFWSACFFIRRLGRMIRWSWIQILCDLPGHKYCAEPARLVAFANAVLCNQRFKDEVLTSAWLRGWGWCVFFATQWSDEWWFDSKGTSLQRHSVLKKDLWLSVHDIGPLGLKQRSSWCLMYE